MSKTEAAVRRTGAVVALAAASGLVVMLVPTVVGSDRAMLALHAVFLIGCAAVLLSPAHRVVPELARRAVETAREFFRSQARAATEIWPALVPLLETGLCRSPSSPAGARAPSSHSQAEATVRRTGALLALGATSVLVLLLFTQVEERRHGMLAAYATFLLGCAAVLLSPAHRAVAELARLTTEPTREIQGASAPANAALRWGGFTTILFCVTSAAADLRAAERVNGLLLFLPLLVGVWAVFLSMLVAVDPPTLPLSVPVPSHPTAAEEGHDGGVVNVKKTAPVPARGIDA